MHVGDAITIYHSGVKDNGYTTVDEDGDLILHARIKPSGLNVIGNDARIKPSGLNVIENDKMEDTECNESCETVEDAVENA